MANRFAASSNHCNRDDVMQQKPESRRSTSARQEPGAGIPKFRKLGLSAVVAACAWERRPLAPRRAGTERKPSRSEKD
jgi:hypothetical protein